MFVRSPVPGPARARRAHYLSAVMLYGLSISFVDLGANTRTRLLLTRWRADGRLLPHDHVIGHQTPREGCSGTQ